MIYGVIRGVGGIVYDPYIGCKQRGLKGGGIGVVKGLGGLVGRPIKGCFDFVAQPIVGVINTPHYIYKKLIVKKDPNEPKVTNFAIFGVDQKEIKKKGKKLYDPVADKSTFLIDAEELEESLQDIEKSGSMVFAKRASTTSPMRKEEGKREILEYMQTAPLLTDSTFNENNFEDFGLPDHESEDEDEIIRIQSLNKHRSSIKHKSSINSASAIGSAMFNSCIDRSIDSRAQNLESIREVLQSKPLLRKTSFDEEEQIFTFKR